MMSQPQRIIARSARLFSEACYKYYSEALAHPVRHWPFCHTEDLRSGCLLKRVFSVSIYFRSVRSRQVQPFLVLSSKHGAICHFSATGPEDLLTSLKSSSDQATRYWSYIRIRTKPPQLFQICRRDLYPSSKRGQNTGQYLTTLCEASYTTAGIRSE